MNQYIDVMLDLETLGTKPGCKILGIGAVVFGVDRRKYPITPRFEIYIKRDRQVTLTESIKTLEWWDKQSKEAKERVFNNPDAIPLYEALCLFEYWFKRLDVPANNIRIWGNAASFDCKILEAAFEYCSIPVPWKHTNERCFRTLKNLVDPAIAPPFEGIAHTPLADAIHQARWAENIFNMLRLNWD